MTSKRKRKRNSSSSSSSSRARVKVVAQESQLVREKVDGYVRGQPDPEQNEQSVSRTATNIRVGAPIRSEKRMNFVWVVKAGAQKGQSKYSLDPESAYIDPRDKQRVTRDKICCDVCGNLLRRPYRVRCYRRRTPYDPPETEVDRKMEADIYLVGHRCMKGLLGIPGEKCAPRSQNTRLRLDIRKTLLNGTIFEMEDNKEGEEQNSKEFKETEIVQALQTELAKVISECAGPEAAWRQLPKESAPREVGVRSGAGCRAFEERPYNEEEDVTEDEGAAVIKLPPKKRNVPRGPKPKATVVTAEPEPEEEEEEEEQGLLPEPAKPSRFMDQHKTMLPLVAQKLSEVSAPHKLYSKVLPGFSRPPFLIVIPTYGRPDRLVRETLAFLRRQKIPQNLIEIWLAPGHAPGQKFSERERYEKALAPEWPDVHIRTGVKGVMQQRWRIGLAHPEGMHLVSFDDDIPEVFEKIKPGTSSDTMQPLEAGSLEAIIHHARDLMHQEGCYIWGLAPSANPMNLVVNRISRRNGMVNGFAYGYLNRHDECFQSLYCSPTEDVERSCRFYEKDGVLLRYLMYAARTKFKAPDGISLLYENARARKLDEEAAIVKISDEFPHLLQVRTGERRRKSEEAMNFTFISIGQGPLLPNGVTTKAWAAGISGQPPIDTGATETKETQVLSEVKVQDPKLKAKLTKQAQDEKELLDKCVQIQEYLLEQQEAAEDALHTGKAPKEQTQSVQKLLENVINGANVDKVIFSKRKAPKPVPPQVEAPRAQVTSQDNGVEVGKLEVMRPPIPALPLATTAALRQDEGVQGAVTPQHLLLATSLAKVQALQQFQSHNWNWGNDFSRDEWWMTRAPVTPPELRQSQVLSVDLSDNEVISASPGHTPPLQGPTEPANKRGLLRPPESDDEDVEIVAVNGETPGGTIFPRLVPAEAPAAPRLVPPEVQGESKEPSLHPEPATEFSDLEDDDFIRRLQDTVTT